MTPAYWGAKIRAVIQEAEAEGMTVFTHNDVLWISHQDADLLDTDVFIIDVGI